MPRPDVLVLPGCPGPPHPRPQARAAGGRAGRPAAAVPRTRRGPIPARTASLTVDTSGMSASTSTPWPPSCPPSSPRCTDCTDRGATRALAPCLNHDPGTQATMSAREPGPAEPALLGHRASRRASSGLVVGGLVVAPLGRRRLRPPPRLGERSELDHQPRAVRPVRQRPRRDALATGHRGLRDRLRPGRHGVAGRAHAVPDRCGRRRAPRAHGPTALLRGRPRGGLQPDHRRPRDRRPCRLPARHLAACPGCSRPPSTPARSGAGSPLARPAGTPLPSRSARTGVARRNGPAPRHPAAATVGARHRPTASHRPGRRRHLRVRRRRRAERACRPSTIGSADLDGVRDQARAGRPPAHGPARCTASGATGTARCAQVLGIGFARARRRDGRGHRHRTGRTACARATGAGRWPWPSSSSGAVLACRHAGPLRVGVPVGVRHRARCSRRCASRRSGWPSCSSATSSASPPASRPCSRRHALPGGRAAAGPVVAILPAAGGAAGPRLGPRRPRRRRPTYPPGLGTRRPSDSTRRPRARCSCPGTATSRSTFTDDRTIATPAGPFFPGLDPVEQRDRGRAAPLGLHVEAAGRDGRARRRRRRHGLRRIALPARRDARRPVSWDRRTTGTRGSAQQPGLTLVSATIRPSRCTASRYPFRDWTASQPAGPAQFTVRAGAPGTVIVPVEYSTGWELDGRPGTAHPRGHDRLRGRCGRGADRLPPVVEHPDRHHRQPRSPLPSILVAGLVEHRADLRPRRRHGAGESPCLADERLLELTRLRLIAGRPYFAVFLISSVIVSRWFVPGTFISTGDMGPWIRQGWEPEATSSWNHTVSGAGSAAFTVARGFEFFVLKFVGIFGGDEYVGQWLFYTLIYGLVGRRRDLRRAIHRAGTSPLPSRPARSRSSAASSSPACPTRSTSSASDRSRC